MVDLGEKWCGYSMCIVHQKGDPASNWVMELEKYENNPITPYKLTPLIQIAHGISSSKVREGVCLRNVYLKICWHNTYFVKDWGHSLMKDKKL